MQGEGETWLRVNHHNPSLVKTLTTAKTEASCKQSGMVESVLFNLLSSTCKPSSVRRRACKGSPTLDRLKSCGRG